MLSPVKRAIRHDLYTFNKKQLAFKVNKFIFYLITLIHLTFGDVNTVFAVVVAVVVVVVLVIQLIKTHKNKMLIAELLFSSWFILGYLSAPIKVSLIRQLSDHFNETLKNSEFRIVFAIGILLMGFFFRMCSRRGCCHQYS